METKENIMRKVSAEETYLRKFGITQIYLCGRHALDTQTEKDEIVMVLDWSGDAEGENYEGFNVVDAFDKIADLFGGMKKVRLPALDRLTKEEQAEVVEEGLRVF